MKPLNRIFAALLLAAPLMAFAQTPPAAPKDPLATPGVDQRQANQQQRIQQGAQSGTLTTKEVNKLEQGQAHVQKLEDKAKSDGVVTAGERARLQHAEDVQSRRIHREKRDRQHDLNHDGKKDHPRRIHRRKHAQ